MIMRNKYGWDKRKEFLDDDEHKADLKQLAESMSE